MDSDVLIHYNTILKNALELAKENKNIREYLRRAITVGTTPLSDEELLNFLELMRNATFGVITVHNNTSKDNSNHDSLSYFVYLSNLMYT